MVAGMVLIPVLHPDDLEQVNINTIIKALAATYTYLKAIQYEDIAILISSYVRDTNTLALEGSGRNILTIPPELEDLFTIRKTGMKVNTDEPIILKETIKIITDGYVKNSLYTILPVKANGSNVVRPVSNLRNRVAELILHINKTFI